MFLYLALFYSSFTYLYSAHYNVKKLYTTLPNSIRPLPYSTPVLNSCPHLYSTFKYYT